MKQQKLLKICNARQHTLQWAPIKSHRKGRLFSPDYILMCFIN